MVRTGTPYPVHRTNHVRVCVVCLFLATQGGCGSCWAFSTAETLESHIALATGKLMEFSPQEFVDCAPNPDECGGTVGCQGSVQWLGFKYAMTAGILTEASYPYKARTNKCGTAGIASVATIKDFVRLPQNNYTCEGWCCLVRPADRPTDPRACCLSKTPAAVVGGKTQPHSATSAQLSATSAQLSDQLFVRQFSDR